MVRPTRWGSRVINVNTLIGSSLCIYLLKEALKCSTSRWASRSRSHSFSVKCWCHDKSSRLSPWHRHFTRNLPWVLPLNCFQIVIDDIIWRSLWRIFFSASLWSLTYYNECLQKVLLSSSYWTCWETKYESQTQISGFGGDICYSIWITSDGTFTAVDNLQNL